MFLYLQQVRYMYHSVTLNQPANQSADELLKKWCGLVHDGTAKQIHSSEKNEVFIACASAVLKGLELMWLGVYLQN